MRNVDERCSVSVRGQLLIRYLPNCTTYHRLCLNPHWYRALDAALELMSKPARSLWEKTRDLNLLLDTLDYELSGLERRIIYTQAMGLNES